MHDLPSRTKLEPPGIIDDTVATLLQKKAEVYSCATQTPCRAVDPQGNFFGAKKTAVRCGLCLAVTDSEERPASSCDEVLRYGILQAERFGGAYMAFCPNSLLITTAVVRKEAETVGALIAGPALLIDREEFIAEEFAKNQDNEKVSLNSVAALLDTIPNLDTVRAKALADMLEIAARDAGAELEGRLDPKAEASKRNAKIAEYIQSLKAQGYDRSDDETNLAGYPFEKERILIHLVTTGNKAGARKVLNEILGAVFFAGGGEIQGVRTRAIELVVLLSRAAVEGGATVQEVFGANEDFMKRISNSRTIDDLASWLAVVLNRFTDFVFTLKRVKHVDMIRKAERFIKAHYNEDITLEDTAREVGLSPSYFSSVFKNEAGNGFVAFLNEIRIAKSKELLKTYNIPISEVSGAVGFVDQSYFSRVFKAIVGVSPGAFRKGNYSPESDIEIHEVPK